MGAGDLVGSAIRAPFDQGNPGAREREQPRGGAARDARAGDDNVEVALGATTLLIVRCRTHAMTPAPGSGYVPSSLKRVQIPVTVMLQSRLPSPLLRVAV